MLAYEEALGLRNVGLGRKRKERNEKMKRRLMRSLTPQGSCSWLQTHIEMHTYAHSHTHLNTMVKATVKAVNLLLSLSTGQQHRKAASLTHLIIRTTQ